MEPDSGPHRKPQISVFHSLVLYVATAFAILEGADLLIDRFALPGWLFLACAGVLVLGVPVVAATAWVQGHGMPHPRRLRARRWLTWRNAAAAGVIAFAVLGAASASQRAMTAVRGDDAAWARGAGLLELKRLAELERHDSTWTLAQRLERIIPDDSAFNALADLYSIRISLSTLPAGLAVYRRFYGHDGTGEYELVGTTPLDSVRVPDAPSRWRLQRGTQVVKELATFDPQLAALRLQRVNSAAPPDMTQVNGDTVFLASPGLYRLPPLPLGDYLLDRYEVTNRQYHRFVAAGGYRRAEFWEHPFVRGRDTLDFAQAMRAFVDRTGRSGPASWEAGDYPEGMADHPVAGISWYEAAAYARFLGRSLPTVYHWLWAAGVPAAEFLLPPSNFGGTGTLPVGRTDAMSPYGNYDMAGNVREWCANANGSDRYILGAGYSDDPYEFTEAISQPPWDRSPINGVRLALYRDSTNLEVAARELTRSMRDYTKERPVADAEFSLFPRLYEYDRRPLGAVVEEIDSVTSEHWISQRIHIDAGYGTERLILHVYLPRNAAPPYQTVVFFPGSGVMFMSSSRNLHAVGGWGYFGDYITKSGRAFIFPVYRGTFERQSGLTSPYPVATAFWREHMISFAIEVRRTIDYVESRPDLDEAKVAFYGYSWGGSLGPVFAAVEPRIKTVVLYVAGLHVQPIYPEVDPLNFLPRVEQPVLLLTGRYDFFFPYSASQKPFFELLGTPRARKRWVVHEGGHSVPRAQLIRETLAWFDEYLGPVTP